MSVLYIVAGLAACVLVVMLLLFFTKTRLRFERKTAPLPKAADVPSEHWSKLAETRIFLGHQSVGYNIVDGLEDVSRKGGGVKLNIIETSSASDFNRPVFAHTKVGTNKQPMSKIEQFAEIINSGVGANVDIAILKFCYVDLTHNQDHRKMFEAYKEMISRLQQRYPHIRFVHFTVPLRSSQKGVEKTIRGFGKWLLMMPAETDDNFRRQQYNKLIRDEYGSTGCIFDLALAESVGPGGLSCYVARHDQRIPFMTPEYSDDGGHLNELGRGVVAEQLLITLSEIAAQTRN